MLVYKIKVKQEGRITQLLDSQKIFGALMHLLTNQGYSSIASEIVSEVEAGNMIFMISNLMPEGYLPVPNIEISEIKSKEEYKKLKARAFVSEKELLEGKIVTEIVDFLEIEPGQSSQNYIRSEGLGIPGLKNALYSVPTIKLVRNKDKEQIKDFCFLLSIEEENKHRMKLMELLERMAQDKTCFLLGQRASQGFNTYRTVEVEKPKKWKQADRYLNLGMLLPNTSKSACLDYNESHLKLFTSERRPYYGRFPGENFSKYENFISFIEAGSIIKLKEFNLTKISKCIDTTNILGSSFQTIIFGNSFLYPLSNEVKV